LAEKPDNLSDAESAAAPTGGLEALHFLTKANIRSGQTVLVNGAGGSIGTFGVQLAKYYGAQVTGVDSAEKLDMLRSIGADRVIDYKKVDFVDSAEKYDVIFDVVGKRSLASTTRALKENGIYLLGNPDLPQMLQAPWISRTTGKRVVIGAADRKKEDLLMLKGLLETGRLKTVIDRSYPLEQMVEAHRYVDNGHKKGNLIIAVDTR
jgi:NADPH:quinone reductase-like Zn-dependent oxidoreductase